MVDWFNTFRSLTSQDGAHPLVVGTNEEQRRKRDASINSISRFSFASIAHDHHALGQEGNSTPWDSGNGPVTSINFDNFHQNITSTDIPITKAPSLIAPLIISQPGDDESTIPRPISNTASVRKASRTGTASRSGPSKRQSTANTTTVKRQTIIDPITSTEGLAANSERPCPDQSQFSTSAWNKTKSAHRIARKSIGTTTLPIRNANPPSLRDRDHSLGTQKKFAGNDGMIHSRDEDCPQVDSAETPHSSSSQRTMRVKSLQPSARNVGGESVTPTWGSEPHSPPSVISNAISGKAPVQSDTTSPLNKRLSVMPSHATGLGARTVSPTDTRRLKRLSMMPHAPPVPAPSTPYTSFIPQPELSSCRPLSGSQSSLIPEYNSSPFPSPENTPDPTRKSYSSRQSLSSITSHSSAKTSNVPTPRQGPMLSISSRRSTPKARSDPNSIDGQDEVPPVPAIPKAYESPTSDTEQPFFSAYSSAPPQAENSISSSPGFKSSFDAGPTGSLLEAAYSSQEAPLFSDPPDAKASGIHRKVPQPITLPPRKVLPLGTPTAAKIMALDKSRSPESCAISPVQRPSNWKPPTTPLTASRVNFPVTSSHQVPTSAANLRSNSSHNILSHGIDSLANTSGLGNDLSFTFTSPDSEPRRISPFISSSLPRSNQDFKAYMRPKCEAEPNHADTLVNILGPIESRSSKSERVEMKTTSNDHEPSFSTASLRRKLSLNRRRSASRARGEAAAGTSAKYQGMPPPKPPTQITWNKADNTDAGPKHKQSHFKSRRKPLGSNAAVEATRSNQSLSSETMLAAEGRSLTDSNPSSNLRPSRSSSLISPATSVPSITSVAQAQLCDTDLDRDDRLAEEEMRQLASKRKDLEAAAIQLDALRLHAQPRQRVGPLKASQAANLNMFEKGEIIDYEHVYFTGTRNARKISGDFEATSTNFGYDDERGDYNIVKGDHLAFRYEVVDLLGKGSFGQVVRCIDHKTGVLVAVKIIRNKKRFHQQALVEVNILRKLREWDPDKRHSVVSFDQSFYFRGHLCISTDLLDMNLYEFIKAHEFAGFSLKLIRRFTKQILGSLILLNGRKVIHCDLKPENILLVHPLQSNIKVIDFGSSCFENEKVYTYIQSRFYRSPEVILGMSYGMPIDMWSLGCILAELFTGYPIFPGENEQEQLACIMEIFGPPEKHLIEKSSRKKLFFDSLGKPRLTVSSKGRRRRPSSKDLRQVLRCDDEGFLDFISRCLRWDPSRRMNPHQAMMHEFVTGTRSSSRKSPHDGSSKLSSSQKAPVSMHGARPLPQPLITDKYGASLPQIETKPKQAGKHSSKRESVINGLYTPSSSKRPPYSTPNQFKPTVKRSIPGQRKGMGRQDLAAAAAAAATMVKTS